MAIVREEVVTRKNAGLGGGGRGEEFRIVHPKENAERLTKQRKVHLELSPLMTHKSAKLVGTRTNEKILVDLPPKLLLLKRI